MAVPLTVYSPTGQEFSIEANFETDKIQDVRTKLVAVAGPVAHSWCIMKDHEGALDDERTLDELQAEEEFSKLWTANPPPPPPFHFFITNAKTAATTYLELPSNDHVEHLKKLIQKFMQVPVEDQILVFQGESLGEGPLNECALPTESFVYLLDRKDTNPDENANADAGDDAQAAK
uniref:Ubiquitin-like domain-containing protein n=1 Tax=Chromera velia CCMP2878 TaxID=1169474 RepID=A0A0G4HH17_9ALVE|eukprot:Cvel_27521.t1-p1 / transcript=Cvel_27521.t1 / gene=Cvel_27521 / organism=Chromera_velia_CCMP2878 / gene_product=hypothetical protein / transcript_product=hypothetical protein / location=Cvel_scaffold3449:3986-4701(+) / protein_length=175 / sequence_SO=supercontig / SO=protein_coding / is_pseudo=false